MISISLWNTRQKRHGATTLHQEQTGQQSLTHSADGDVYFKNIKLLFLPTINNVILLLMLMIDVNVVQSRHWNLLFLLNSFILVF